MELFARTIDIPAANRKWGNEAVKKRGFHPTAKLTLPARRLAPKTIVKPQKYISWAAFHIEAGQEVKAAKSVIFFHHKSKAATPDLSSLASRYVILCLNCDLHDSTMFDHYFLITNPCLTKKKLVSLLKSQVNLGYVGERVESEADCDNGQEATAGPRLSCYYYITTITTLLLLYN